MQGEFNEINSDDLKAVLARIDSIFGADSRVSVSIPRLQIVEIPGIRQMSVSDAGMMLEEPKPGR